MEPAWPLQHEQASGGGGQRNGKAREMIGKGGGLGGLMRNGGEGRGRAADGEGANNGGEKRKFGRNDRMKRG